MDGEVICIDRNGVSQFNALFSRKGRPVFYAFDLMWHDDEDVRKTPLIERKKRLRELGLNSGCKLLIYAQHIEKSTIKHWLEIGAGGGNRTHGLGIMRPSLYH